MWKTVHNMLLVTREEHGTGSYGMRAPGWRVGVLQRLLSGLFPHLGPWVEQLQCFKKMQMLVSVSS